MECKKKSPKYVNLIQNEGNISGDFLCGGITFKANSNGAGHIIDRVAD